MPLNVRKKLASFIGTVAIIIINALLPEPILDSETVTKLAGVAGAYFIGQGFADLGEYWVKK